MAVRKMLEENRGTITNRYLAGESTVSLGKAFGCSNASVYVALRDWGVSIRPTKVVAPNREKILALNAEGKSAYRINKMLGLSNGTAERCLKDAGFDISHRQRKRADPLVNHKDEIISRYEAWEGSDHIAADYNTSGSNIRRLLRREGVETRTVRDYAYPVNESFFDVVDNEAKAYILGFFMADGCNQTDVPCVGFAITDLDIFERIKSEMGFEGPTTVVRPKVAHHLVRYEMRIGSRHMSDALARLGCVARKSYCATFPGPDIVPDDLVRHLVRGWLDGDGTITCNRNRRRRWHARIVGTEAVCRGLSALSLDHFGFPGCVCPLHVGPNHTTWGFTVGARKQLKAFLDWLYDDATIFLPRKRDKYVQFLTDFNASKLARCMS